MEYRDLVFAALLKHDGDYVIAQKVKKENQLKFIGAVKEIIDRGIDAANGVVVEFNNDYSLVRMRKPFKADNLRSWIKKVNNELNPQK